MSIASQLSFSTATSIRGGALGSIPYQNATSSTVFVSIGVAGTVLTSSGASVPIWAPASGTTVGTSTQVQTVLRTTTATHYLTFVDSNNATATAEAVYTTSTLAVNPSTGIVSLSGANVSGTVTATLLVITGSGGDITGANNITATGLISGGSLVIGSAAGGVTGEIRATNEITAYYSSDIRLKENIKLIADPITIVNQIRGVYYDWTDDHIKTRGGEDGYFVRKHDIGVIAQEVEKVLPEIVATRDDGIKVVKYEKLVALLIEAVKDQQQQINQISQALQTLAIK